MDTIELLKQGKAGTLAGSDYILTEFSPDEEWAYIRNCLYDLLCEGYRPIVAHTERYRNVVKDFNRVEELKDMGCRIQINAGELPGLLGGQLKRTARSLIKEELADLIGTDAHRVEGERSVSMAEGASWLQRHCSPEYAARLLYKTQHTFWTIQIWKTSNRKRGTRHGKSKPEKQRGNRNRSGRTFFGTLEKASADDCSGTVYSTFGLWGKQIPDDAHVSVCNKIYILNKQDSSNANVTYSDLQAGTQLVKDYSELIKSRFVLEAVIEQLNLPLSYEQLSDKVTVSTPADTRVISIAVTDSNPVTAMKIANAIRETASTHIRNVMDIETVNIVETANVPTHKASPSARKNTALGGMLGILIVAAIVILSHLMNDTIQTEEDVEKYLGISTLAMIPLNEADGKKKKKNIKTGDKRKVR